MSQPKQHQHMTLSILQHKLISGSNNIIPDSLFVKILVSNGASVPYPGRALCITPYTTNKELQELYLIYKDITNLEVLSNYDLRNIDKFVNNFPEYIHKEQCSHVLDALSVLCTHDILPTYTALKQYLLPIMPRYFACANFSSNPNYAEVFITRHPHTQGHRHYDGLCSTSILEKDNILYKGHVLSYRAHTPDIYAPIIMICEGAGIAPCRAIWQYRNYYNHNPCSLLIAHKNSPELSFVKEEITAYNIPLITFEDATELKTILSNSQQVSNLLQDHANIFVCASNARQIPDWLNHNQHFAAFTKSFSLSPSQFLNLYNIVYR